MSSLHRPEPVLRLKARRIDADTSSVQAAEALLRGEKLRVVDHFRRGVEILECLEARIDWPGPDADYASRRAAERRFREVAQRLLAPIEGHRLALEGATPIGFLSELYPEKSSFWLPFIQVQELYGAWERYRDGIHLAVLGHKLHPFFGTYVPTRTTHIELFGTWLSQYDGARTQATDVGTGCGVLALMLAKSGFDRVRATDINPNAVESVTRELERRPTRPPIDPVVADLLGEGTDPVDLVVFNPPWTQGKVEGLLDHALIYEPGLFERFFEQAHQQLSEEGRVVLLFSNIIQLVQPDVPHPILSELERGRFRQVQKMQRKVKPGRDAEGRRRRTRERVEIWELARS
jgi:hypothetical protein